MSFWSTLMGRPAEETPQERFVRLRAEGRSLKDVAENVGIRVTVAMDWDQELAEDVATARARKTREEQQLRTAADWVRQPLGTHTSSSKCRCPHCGRLALSLMHKAFLYPLLLLTSPPILFSLFEALRTLNCWSCGKRIRISLMSLWLSLVPSAILGGVCTAVGDPPTATAGWLGAVVLA